MGETAIGWTDFSDNPIRARIAGSTATKGGYASGVGHYCEKISAGCKNCYSSALQPKFGLPVFQDQRGGAVESFFDASKLEEVLRRKKPTKIFWCDMTDMFGAWVPFEWIAACFGVMAATPHHTHQVLTKRPDRALAFFEWVDERAAESGGLHVGVCAAQASLPLGVSYVDFMPDEMPSRWPMWPLPNVHLGVSVEDQANADKRIPILLKCPASVHWISYEPALGPVDFRRWLDGSNGRERGDCLPGGDIEVDRSPGGRIDLAHSPEAQKSLAWHGDREAGGAASDRCPAERRGLSDGEGHGGRRADVLPGSPIGMASYQGADSTGHHDQSRGRRQGQQSTDKPDAGDLLGTTITRAPDGLGLAGRRNEPIGEANESGNRRGQSAVRDGNRDTAADRGLPRRGVSDDLKDRQRRESTTTGRPDGGLRESSCARDARQERTGTVLIRQIIVGGESGTGHRPFDPTWADDVVKQCSDAGIACFVKQDSGPKPGKQGRISDATWAHKEFPRMALEEIASSR